MFVEMIDKLFNDYDSDKDGFFSFWEYMIARQTEDKAAGV